MKTDATRPQVYWAMISAARSLIGRRLTEREQAALIDVYESVTGPHRKRARRAITMTCRMTLGEIRAKRRFDANVDRLIRDLEDLRLEAN